jgi:hypothetical protein
MSRPEISRICAGAVFLALAAVGTRSAFAQGAGGGTTITVEPNARPLAPQAKQPAAAATAPRYSELIGRRGVRVYVVGTPLWIHRVEVDGAITQVAMRGVAARASDTKAHAFAIEITVTDKSGKSKTSPVDADEAPLLDSALYQTYAERDSHRTPPNQVMRFVTRRGVMLRARFPSTGGDVPSQLAFLVDEAEMQIRTFRDLAAIQQGLRRAYTAARALAARTDW